MKVYQQIASSMQAILNCRKSGNTEWITRHQDTIKNIVCECLPHGSGIDADVLFDFSTSNGNRLAFDFAFHHMNESGMYDGWTDHTVIVTPDLASGYNLRITGRDRQQIKDYLADTFSYALDQEITREQLEKLAA